MIWQTNARAYLLRPDLFNATLGSNPPWPIGYGGKTREELFESGFVVAPFPRPTDAFDTDELMCRFDMVAIYELEPGEIVNAMVPASTQSIALRVDPSFVKTVGGITIRHCVVAGVQAYGLVSTTAKWFQWAYRTAKGADQAVNNLLQEGFLQNVRDAEFTFDEPSKVM